jgi:hypothetical protein
MIYGFAVSVDSPTANQFALRANDIDAKRRFSALLDPVNICLRYGRVARQSDCLSGFGW